jgi:hypothetical protein
MRVRLYTLRETTETNGTRLAMFIGALQGTFLRKHGYFHAIASKDVKPHVGDVPWCGDSEDLGVEGAAAHSCTVGGAGRAGNQLAGAAVPTRIPEDPKSCAGTKNSGGEL